MNFILRLNISFPADNGLNPVWSDSIELAVFCPPMAYIRFAVYDEDMFGDPNFIAQAVYPLCSLKQGTKVLFGDTVDIATTPIKTNPELTDVWAPNKKDYTSGESQLGSFSGKLCILTVRAYVFIRQINFQVVSW